MPKKLNQSIRFKERDDNDVNNPHGLYSYLIRGDTLAGNGAPSPTVGTINSTYVNKDTGEQFLKNGSGVWEPLLNYSTFGGSVPDPLPVGEIQVDTIKGKTSDSILVDAGLNGDINMTLGPTNILNINSGNITMQGNGVINSLSPITGYEILSDNTSGKQILLSANTNELNLIGPDPYTVQAINAGASLTLKANAADVVLDAGAAKIKVNSANLANTTNNTFIIEHETAGEDVELKCESTGAGNVVLRPGAGGGQVQTVENLSLQGNFLVDVGNIQHTTGSIFTIENTSNNQDVLIRTTGAGQLRLNSGTSEVKVETPATFNPFGLTTASINASQTYTSAKSLIVNHSGGLVWSEPPETVIFHTTNVGANGTIYLNCAGLAVNPADISLYPVLAPNMTVRRVEAVLLNSVDWGWGGVGTATLEFGSVSSGLPATTANWVPVFNLPITVIGNWYFTLSLPNVLFSAGGAKMGVRLVTSGTSATSAQAELLVKVILSS